MQRDPTPPSSIDAHTQNAPYLSSPLKTTPSAAYTGGSYGSSGMPSLHGPSASYGGHPSQEFGGSASSRQPFDSQGRGHTPAASWSGPDGAFTTPGFAPPLRQEARDTDQTYTSPEMARAGANYSGPSSGPYAGQNGGPVAGPGGENYETYRGQRFSMPVSDEDLRATADIVNNTRTFIFPPGSFNGAVPLGALDFLGGPFQAHIGFPTPQPHEHEGPWDKSASIHTLYSELPKESTPPMSTPVFDGVDRADSEVSRAPTVPPKDTPKATPKSALATSPSTKAALNTPKAATPVPSEEPKTPKVAFQEVKTPRMSDLHLPSDPSAAPAIRLQPPTTTDPTAATAATTTSKSNSTPVADSNPRTNSSSSQEPAASSASRALESFVASQAQPQLPAYQSQPSSPTGLPGPQRAYFDKKGSGSLRRKPVLIESGISGPNGTAAEKARQGKRDKERKRHSPDNKSSKSKDDPASSTRHGAPSYTSDPVPRGVDSMMSPETTTVSGLRELRPPDHVTERLYAWAGAKPEHAFVETLERLSGGDEVRPVLTSPAPLFLLQLADDRSASFL